jgi:hypothetical protein
MLLLGVYPFEFNLSVTAIGLPALPLPPAAFVRIAADHRRKGTGHRNHRLVVRGIYPPRQVTVVDVGSRNYEHN